MTGIGGGVVDQEHGLSPLPVPDVGSGICSSCALAGSADQSARLTAGYVAEAIDEEAVVVSRPGLEGLMVVPRQHISGLDELPGPRRARLLAALRRATQS